MFVPVAVLAVLHVGGEAAAPAGKAAGPSLLSAATSTVFVIGPVAAGAAAWQTGRLRRSHVLAWAPRRAHGWLTADVVLPVVAAGWGTLALAIGRAVVIDPSPPGGWGAAAPGLAVAAAVVIAALSALGALAGWFLPSVAAVPASMVVTYLWLVFPIAFEPMWVRHLTGFRSSCCYVGTEIVPSAAFAPAALGVGLVLAVALVVWRVPPTVARAGASIAVAVAAVFVARVPVADLGPDPVRARTTGLECRPVTDGAVRSGGADGAELSEVCLWAEHEQLRSVVVGEVSALAAAAHDRGVTLPRTVTEGPATDGVSPGAWRFGTSVDADPFEVRAALASGLLGTVACDDTISGPSGPVATDLAVVAWLLLAAGTPGEEVATRLGPEARDAAEVVLMAPAQAQGEWFVAQIAALRDCARPSVPLPATSAGTHPGGAQSVVIAGPDDPGGP